ncbi:phosphoenolpyruvate-protein phosphotransferase [Lysinibacillus contaminans]|uniref:Phosphoenolpyruvate-protein phosphotransferase n=1 Tax=Lysinibacillus contaminans TaxID=1293441 RepID=A0ABR5JZ38_9BACI|nr:phosphoenolpyruvate--protein phosphotransferase [Lysinibacillus contaminans]KOS67901.1 phosphoenolpyruvate-protein phosphotransferase [Lysinibacillus contaminans]
MLELNGIAVSNGIAVAKAYCLIEPDLSFEKVRVTDIDAEKIRLKEAFQKAKSELEEVRDIADRKFGEEKAAIFSAHLLLLGDPEMLEAIEAKIDDGWNAEFALQETSNMYIEMFEAMDNEYMQERAADVRDVSTRVLSHLLGVEITDFSRISTDVIIVAEDLTPSLTAQLDKTFVKGFITDIGGRTSHSAILARTMEIPAIVGTKTATRDIVQGAQVIIDGSTGKVIMNATEEVLNEYLEKQKKSEEERQLLEKYRSLESVSADGHHVEIAGNIGKPEDVELIIENGGDGIGLFRTEFLYMDRQELPNEEEQFTAYKTVLEKMQGKPTVVRTLDIGGDKILPYLKLEHEMNPFLGYRAVRLCLDQQDIFRTQLRALLRASIYGNLKVMFPMIATLEEFREAKALLLEEKQKLIEEGIPVSESIEVGMMVEIPSAAVIADLFAKEADFLSIGTNDLIQYTLAADRMNEKISYLYQPYHPAIIRLVKSVIESAHQHGKWVGMCGEMAGDEIAIPILLALGLDEFSMSAPSILNTRAQIAKLSKSELVGHLEQICTLTTANEVEGYVKKYLLK